MSDEELCEAILKGEFERPIALSPFIMERLSAILLVSQYVVRQKKPIVLINSTEKWFKVRNKVWNSFSFISLGI